MNKIVVFPEGENVSVVFPTEGVSLDLVIAYSVPEGVPYLVLTRDDMPIDHIFRDAWEVDFSTPDGISVGRENFDSSQLELRLQP